MIARTKTRPRGRPPKGFETMYERINIRVPSELMRRIEAIRALRVDGPDRATIIRELLLKATERQT